MECGCAYGTFDGYGLVTGNSAVDMFLSAFCAWRGGIDVPSIAWESTMMSEAEQLRIQWASTMGLTPQEIDESIQDDPPIDSDYERQQLEAIQEIQRLAGNRR